MSTLAKNIFEIHFGLNPTILVGEKVHFKIDKIRYIGQTDPIHMFFKTETIDPINPYPPSVLIT